MTRLRCAILDDYLNVALSVADWSKVSDRVDITVFNQPFATAEAAAADGSGVAAQPDERHRVLRTLRDLFGIEPALVWTRAPLRSLGQWRVWRRQR